MWLQWDSHLIVSESTRVGQDQDHECVFALHHGIRPRHTYYWTRVQRQGRKGRITHDAIYCSFSAWYDRRSDKPNNFTVSWLHVAFPLFCCVIFVSLCQFVAAWCKFRDKRSCIILWCFNSGCKCRIPAICLQNSIQTHPNLGLIRRLDVVDEFKSAKSGAAKRANAYDRT